MQWTLEAGNKPQCIATKTTRPQFLQLQENEFWQFEFAGNRLSCRTSRKEQSAVLKRKNSDKADSHL